MNPEETISGDDVHNYSEKEEKMAWMRETRIRIFMQMELKACLHELDWLIKCHNCATYNCSQEECRPRPLPAPLDYIHNLQSRLVKIKRGILPPTLKVVLKTYYPLPPRQASVHPQ